MAYEISYWWRFREQDGSWSQWFRCSLEEYENKRLQKDVDTTFVTKAAAQRQEGGSNGND